jgi:hypothetical protein
MGTGDILSKTVAMLLSRQGFGFWETQRFKGSETGNFDFDEMDATRFTNGHTFAGSWAGGPNSKLRLKSQAWGPTVESPELI